MNKKIFTLLASTLVLFMTAFVSYGQPWLGEPVKSLSSGTADAAYHLRITRLGFTNKLTPNPTNPGTGAVLAVDPGGNLTIRDASYYTGTGTSLEQLNRTLWCVNTAYGFDPGHNAQLSFTNKGTLSELGVGTTGMALNVIWESAWPEGATLDKRRMNVYTLIGSPEEGHHTDNVVALGGPNVIWESGVTLDTRDEDFYLRAKHPTKPDYYYTLAVADTTPAGYSGRGLMLAEAHYNDFLEGSKFSKEHLVYFSLYETVPRVLTAPDIKGLLGLSTGTGHNTGDSDPFKNIKEVEQAGTSYVHLKTTSGGYITAKDRDDPYPGYGERYISIDDKNSSPDTKGRSDFRFIYYPSDGHVVINVKTILPVGKEDKEENTITDGVSTQYSYPTFWGNPASGMLASDSYFTWDILNYLLVQIQRIEPNGALDVPTVSAGDVPTVKGQYLFPAGAIGCRVAVDEPKTSVESGLYLIKAWKERDSDPDRYLNVPLYAGGFTPVWSEVADESVARNTPSFHWLVSRLDKSATSQVKLINREFEKINFEYYQVYNEHKPFKAQWNETGSESKYGTMVEKAEVDKTGFKKLSGNHISDPWLGYKFIGDEFTAESYSLKYYHQFSPNTYYISSVAQFDQNGNDSTLVAVADPNRQTYFHLTPPDPRIPEEYGIDTATYNVAGLSGADRPARLKRSRYIFEINAYSTVNADGDVLTLSPDRSYVNTRTETANVNKLGGRGEFFLRYTHEKDGEPYYTILQHIADSDFPYISAEFSYVLADTLWSQDPFSGEEKPFGVLLLSVDDRDLKVRATQRYGTNNLASTFALEVNPEPFYRRLNSEGLGLPGDEEGDKPHVIKIYRANTAYESSKDYLYEDQHSAISYKDGKLEDGSYDYYASSTYGNGINFLSYINEATDREHDANDDGGWFPHKFGLYVEPAFISETDALLKPQYLISVNMEETDALGYPENCPTCIGGDAVIPERRYRYGRYLVNARDSGFTSAPGVTNPDYVSKSEHPRLVFVDAVYAYGEGKLYILPTQTKYKTDNSGEIYDKPIKKYIDKLGGFYGGHPKDTEYLNFAKLVYGGKNELGDTVIGIGPDNVKNVKTHDHENWLFSFRFADRTEGPTGTFHIESESENPDEWFAPSRGGWLKTGADGLVEISSGDLRKSNASNSISDADVWQLELADDEIATGNAPAVTSSSVQVISGEGSVTILNAAGKQVVISNVLGQTVSRAVLTSDAATLSVPKGVLVISVEGEPASKAIVK
jgi:hypothetical protein